MDDISAKLKRIKPRGSFFAKRSIDTDALCVDIKGCGPLRLPLSTRKAKALIDVATPAKFGLRDKTLLDNTVRHAWEIPKSKINIDHKQWNKTVKPTLALLKKDLGLPEDATLQAHLHNLLIYAPGQFFSPHQDSEKVDGMVASLVLFLPSAHRGGTLIIDHQGDKKRVQTSRFPLNALTLVAFYADCHHEVKKVTKGYRVALTYHLVLKHHQKNVARPEKKAYHSLIKSLRTYFAQDDHANDTLIPRQRPKKWVYLLDHSYTQKGLSWDQLKNADNLRAQALQAAADALELEMNMALADVKETWDCEFDGAYIYGEKSDYLDDVVDDDDVYPAEIIVSETVLQHWIDQKGKRLMYNGCYVPNSQICWTKATDEFKPFESEYEGYMGNYGNTMDRWYHRAAITLWRKKDHYPVLFEMDPVSVINTLHKLTQSKSQEKRIQVTHMQDIVRSLLPYWPNELMQRDTPLDGRTVFELILYVDDPQLAHAMASSYTIDVLSPTIATLFLSLQALYGTPWCLNVFNAWTTPKNTWRTPCACQHIAQTVKKLSANKDGLLLAHWLIAYQLKKIKEDNVFHEKHSSRVQLMKSSAKRIKDVLLLCQACIIANNLELQRQAIHTIIDHITLYPALDLMRVFQRNKAHFTGQHAKKWGYQTLFNVVLNELKKEHANGLRRANDWSIREKIPCACDDCLVLKDFLTSKQSKTMTWPLAKKRRAHIHRAIDELGVPVTHQTEHIGSPHKLVLTKTNKLHTQAKKRFTTLEQTLADLSKTTTKSLS